MFIFFHYLTHTTAHLLQTKIIHLFLLFLNQSTYTQGYIIDSKLIFHTNTRIFYHLVAGILKEGEKDVDFLTAIFLSLPEYT